MKTHYDPYSEYPERGSCGVWLGETSSITGDWRMVTCNRCRNMRARIIGEIAETERAIVDQMGDMAKFMDRQDDAKH